MICWVGDGAPSVIARRALARRSNPEIYDNRGFLDCFATLAMTGLGRVRAKLE